MKNWKKTIALWLGAAMIFTGCAAGQTETEPSVSTIEATATVPSTQPPPETTEAPETQSPTEARELTVVVDAESYHNAEPDGLGVPMLYVDWQSGEQAGIYRLVWDLENGCLTEPEYVCTVENPVDGIGLKMVWTGRNVIVGNRNAADVADGYAYVALDQDFSHSGGTYVTSEQLHYFTSDGAIASVKPSRETPLYTEVAPEALGSYQYPTIIAVEDGQAVVVFYKDTSSGGEVKYSTYPVNRPDEEETKTAYYAQSHVIETYPWTGALADGKVYMAGMLDVMVLDIASGQVYGLGLEAYLMELMQGCSSWSPVSVSGCYDDTVIVSFGYTVEGETGVESRQFYDYYFAVRDGRIMGMLKNQYRYGVVDETWSVCDSEGQEISTVDAIPADVSVIFAHDG